MTSRQAKLALADRGVASGDINRAVREASAHGRWKSPSGKVTLIRTQNPVTYRVEGDERDD